MQIFIEGFFCLLFVDHVFCLLDGLEYILNSYIWYLVLILVNKNPAPLQLIVQVVQKLLILFPASCILTLLSLRIAALIVLLLGVEGVRLSVQSSRNAEGLVVA